MSSIPRSSLRPREMFSIWGSCMIVSLLTAAAVSLLVNKPHAEPGKQDALQQIVIRAKTDSDHERAYRAIDHALLIPTESCDSGAGSQCIQEHARVEEEARDEAARIALKAAAEGESWALDLPTRSPRFPWGATRQRDDTLSSIAALALGKAEKSEVAGPDDLYRAGLLYQFGVYVLQDFRKAQDLLELAWTKGNAKAPAQLAELAKILKEPETAYLWAVRCTRPCVLAQPLDRFFEGIPPDEIRAIQKLAKSKSMVGYSSGRYSSAD